MFVKLGAVQSNVDVKGEVKNRSNLPTDMTKKLMTWGEIQPMSFMDGPLNIFDLL